MMHIGVHSKGVFDELRVKKLDAPDLKRHAKEAQQGMKKLRHTLEEIHNFAMTHGKKARLSLVCRDGVLQVMERESADSYLPPSSNLLRPGFYDHATRQPFPAVQETLNVFLVVCLDQCAGKVWFTSSLSQLKLHFS